MKAKITLPNIKGFLQGNLRLFLDSIGSLPDHISEQAEWRLKQVEQMSPECIRSKECIKCGCEIFGKLVEDRKCSNEPPCYPEMMSKEEWTIFKLNQVQPKSINDEIPD